MIAEDEEVGKGVEAEGIVVLPGNGAGLKEEGGREEGRSDNLCADR